MASILYMLQRGYIKKKKKGFLIVVSALQMKFPLGWLASEGVEQTAFQKTAINAIPSRLAKQPAMSGVLHSREE